MSHATTFTLRAQPTARQRFVDLTTGLQTLAQATLAPEPRPAPQPEQHPVQTAAIPVSVPVSATRPEPRVSAFSLSAKSLKCCITLSATEIDRIRVKGHKQELHIVVAGRLVRVWLNAKSLRKAKNTIYEFGVDNVVVKIDGRLDNDDVLLDAGLQCMPKIPPKVTGADALPVSVA